MTALRKKERWGKSLSSEVRERLDLALERYENPDEMINAALSCLLNQVVNIDDLGLNDKELDEVNSALKVSGLTKAQLLKRGLLAEARRENSIAEKRTTFESLDEETLRKGTKIRGVAEFRIGKAVEALINHNSDLDRPIEEKYFINQSTIFRLSGSNIKSIQEYLKHNQDLIDKHNHEYGLEESINRKSVKVNGVEKKDIKAVFGW